mgnify:CR=1 FL=1
MTEPSLSPQAMIIQTSKTLGELLKSIRTLSHRTQAAVARDAEIPPAFLSSLEQDLKLRRSSWSLWTFLSPYFSP